MAVTTFQNICIDLHQGVLLRWKNGDVGQGESIRFSLFRLSSAVQKMPAEKEKYFFIDGLIC